MSERRDVSRLAAYYFAYFAYMGAFGTYFPLWLKARDYSSTEVAFVLSLPQLLRIVAPLGWARLAEHLGTSRAIVVITAAANMLLCAWLGVSASVLEVTAISALMGLASSSVLPLVEATAMVVVAGDSGRYGGIRLWGSIGFTISVLAVGAVLDVEPITWLAPIVSGMISLAIVTASRLPTVRASHAADARAGWSETIAQPGVIPLFGACFFMMAGQGALFSFYSIHVAAHGFSTTVIGVLWTVSVVAEIVAYARMPVLRARFSHRRLLLASFAIAIVRFLAIGWGASSLVVLLAAQLMHAGTSAVFNASALALVHRMFPGALAARGQALYAGIALGLAGVCGSLLAGWLGKVAGTDVAFTASAGFAAVAAIIVLAHRDLGT